MSYGISSGVNERIRRQQEIFDAEDELEGGDIRELVAAACPVPNPKILARLQRAWERGPDFSLRFPWQSRANFDKYKEGYNEQNVMFFARILTMLADLGILPPAQVQAQGTGGSKGGMIPADFDGPVQITPDDAASTPTFNVARDEKEAKENVLNDGPGGLAEAALAQNLQIVREGRNQALALIDYVRNNPTGDMNEDAKRSGDMQQLLMLTVDSEVLLADMRRLQEQKEETMAREALRREFTDDFTSLYTEMELEVDQQQMMQNRERIRDLDATMWLLKDRMDAKEGEMIELQKKLMTRREQQIILPRVVWNLQNERKAALIPGDNYADQLGRNFDEQGDVIPNARATGMIRRMYTWAEGIRRRLPHSRLTRQQQEVVELVLPPVVELEFADEDIEEEAWIADHPEIQEWKRYLGRNGVWRRHRLLFLIATFLAVAVAVAIPTILVHRNESQTVEDELVRLFLALDEKTHWFRQLPLRAWQRIITLTPRDENYLLLQQVADLQLHFPSDEYVLWQIDFCLFDENQSQERALQWFNQVTKPDVAYRTKHATELTAIANAIKDKYLLDAFEYCVICRANDSALNVISAFYQANPVIAKTHTLFTAATEAKSQISHDMLFPTRTSKYEALVKAFSDVLRNQEQPYYSAWIHEMKLRYKASKFYERLPEEAFDNFLQELALHSQKYPSDAKDVVGDFLNRFTTNIDELPFFIATNELKWDEDIYHPTTQLLQDMRSYHNDGNFDAVSYDVFNEHWDKHSAKTEYKTFEESVAFLDLDTQTKYMLYVLLASVDNGLVTFTQDAMKDVAESSDEFPDVLPSVSLYRQQEVNDTMLNSDQDRRISSTNRHILFTTQDQGYTFADAPFLRTSKYVLMKVGLVSFFMITTEGNQRYANLVEVTSPYNALPAPEGDTQTQGQREYGVTVYRKPVEESNNGLVLFNTTWSSFGARLFVMGALLFLSSRITGSHGPILKILVAGWGRLEDVFGPDVMAVQPYVAPVLTGLAARASDLTFTKGVVLAGMGASWWYGSNATLTAIDKAADTAVKVSQSATQAGMGLAAVVLSGVVVYVLVDNVSTRKKRKLF